MFVHFLEGVSPFNPSLLFRCRAISKENKDFKRSVEDQKSMIGKYINSNEEKISKGFSHSLGWIHSVF